MASDNFAGTNGTALASHDANWSSIDGTFTVANLKIDTNQCQIANNNYNSAGAYYNSSSADLSQLLCKAQTSAGTGLKYVTVRAGTSAKGYALYLSAPSGGNWTRANLYKNGAFLANVTVSIPTTADHTLKITASGTSSVLITGYVDGVSTITYTDSSSPLASNHPGFYVSGNGVAADNYVDDWTDGASAGFTGTYAASQIAQSHALAATLGFSGAASQSQPAQSQVLAALLAFTGNASQIQAANAEAISALLGFSGTVSQQQAAQAQAIFQALGPITGAVASTQAAQIATLTASLAFGGASAQTQAAQVESLAAVLSFAGSTVQAQQSQVGALEGLLSFGGTVTQAQAIQAETLAAILAFSGAVDQSQSQQSQALTDFIAALRAILTITARDPLALQISTVDPLALTVVARDPLELQIYSR